MCGINGILSFNRNDDLCEMVSGMNDKIIHRGPDDSGIWQEENVCLGMRRLSIIDLTGGHQPILSSSGRYVIVMNGEIYNYLELREEMVKKGKSFKTRSDTEVFVELFAEEGVKSIEKVNGMFALAIWDRECKELYLFRDRVGIKPLFYHSGPGTFAFASSLQSFNALPFIDFKISAQSIIKQLKYGYIPSPNSIIDGVSKLEPGYYLKIDKNNTFQKICYWKPELSVDHSKNIAEWSDELNWLLEDALRLQTRSDVPVGAFLSGGYDSSAVVAFMSKITSDINTFSLGFENGRNELPLARLVAERYQTKHHEFVLKESDIPGLLFELIPYLDEPLADNSIIPTYFLSKKVKEKGIKVILNGSGGDEIFGGYSRYMSRSNYERYFNLLPNPLLRLFGHLIFPFSKSRSILLSHPETAYFKKISGINPDFLYSILVDKKLFNDFTTIDSLPGEIIQYPVKDAKQLFRKDLQTYLTENVLSLTDKMTMAHSIEGRVPLLDHRIIETVYRMPIELILYNNEQKGFMKHLLRNHIPAQLYTLKKSGFAGPTSSWVSGPLWDWVTKELTEEPIEPFSGLFNLNIVKEKNSKFKNNRHTHETLFSLAIISAWYKATKRG